MEWLTIMLIILNLGLIPLILVIHWGKENRNRKKRRMMIVNTLMNMMYKVILEEDKDAKKKHTEDKKDR